MPDFGMSPYAWGKDSLSEPGVGGCAADAVTGFEPEYGVPDWLQKRLGDWSVRYESTYDTPGFDWTAFHREGLELAKQLKRALGDDFTVVYEKPWEDPNREIDERVVVE